MFTLRTPKNIDFKPEINLFDAHEVTCHIEVEEKQEQFRIEIVTLINVLQCSNVFLGRSCMLQE